MVSPLCGEKGYVTSFDDLHTLLIIKVLPVVYNECKGCNFLVSAARQILLLEGLGPNVLRSGIFLSFFFFCKILYVI